MFSADVDTRVALRASLAMERACCFAAWRLSRLSSRALYAASCSGNAACSRLMSTLSPAQFYVSNEERVVKGQPGTAADDSQ